MLSKKQLGQNEIKFGKEEERLAKEISRVPDFEEFNDLIKSNGQVYKLIRTVIGWF